MRGAEGVVVALGAAGEAREAAPGAQGADAVAAAGQDLVRIRLVADVPDQLVARRVEDGVERDGRARRRRGRRRGGRRSRRRRRSSRRAARRASCRSSASDRPLRSAGMPIRSSSGVGGRCLAHRPRSSTKCARGAQARRRRAVGGERVAGVVDHLARPAVRAVDAEERHEGRLAARRVLAEPLAGGLGVALDVEQIVGELVGEPDRGTVATQRLDVRAPENGAGFGGPDEERAGLQRLQVGDVIEVERPRRGLGGHVERLAADHAHRAGGLRQPQDQPRLQPRLDRALRRGEKLEGEGLQRVAGQDRGRLIPFHVHGRLAAAQRVVVHAGQVVVHQAVGVDAFDRGGGAQRLPGRDAEDRRALDREEGAEALAAAEHRMPHGGAECGVAGGQEAVERLLGAGGGLAQDGVELQRLGVHGRQGMSTGRARRLPSGPWEIPTRGPRRP